jgi:hypothetical protein
MSASIDAQASSPGSRYAIDCPHRVVSESGLVVDGHRRHVDLCVQTNMFDGSFEIRGHIGLDHTLRMLIGYEWGYNPILAVLPSVHPLPDDAYDNQFRLDVDSSTGLAAIACTLAGPRPGMWFTRGDPAAPTTPHGLVWDYHTGNESLFPPGAAIPVETMLAAIHEFYDLNGAQLPTCVDWQAAPTACW